MCGSLYARDHLLYLLLLLLLCSVLVRKPETLIALWPFTIEADAARDNGRSRSVSHRYRLAIDLCVRQPNPSLRVGFEAWWQ